MTDSSPNGPFSGRTVLVTGAARGIGFATAEALERQGAALALTDLDEQGLARVAATFASRGARVIHAAGDGRDTAFIDGFVARTESEFGPIDGLVPCAGIARAMPAEEMTDAVFDDVLAVNLNAVFRVCRAVGRRMLARRRGAIVNLASISAKGGQPGRANYAASKWAVAGLTKTLAVEWGARGVRVNAVAPNGVATPMILDGLPKSFVEGVMVDRTPLARLAEPGEVADAILFLLSDKAAYINGAVLEVDGGVTAGFMTHRHGGDLAMKERE